MQELHSRSSIHPTSAGIPTMKDFCSNLAAIAEWSGCKQDLFLQTTTARLGSMASCLARAPNQISRPWQHLSRVVFEPGAIDPNNAETMNTA